LNHESFKLFKPFKTFKRVQIDRICSGLLKSPCLYANGSLPSGTETANALSAIATIT
jgi:hypothetical protein